MGRKASHVAFECALQSHPNMVRFYQICGHISLLYKTEERASHPFFNCSLQLILGEEVALSKLTLMEIINKICDGIQARAELGLYSSLIVMLQQLVEKKTCSFG